MRYTVKRKVAGIAIAGMAMALCGMAALPASAQTDWVLEFDRVEEESENVLVDSPHPIADGDPVTLEVWIKWDGGDSPQAGIWGNAGSATHWEIRDDGMRIRMGNDDITGMQAPPANEWAHVAVSHDGAVMSYFLNGELIDSTETPRSDWTATARFGNSMTNSSRPYGGQMAEVRLWRAARTEQQLQDNMRSRLQGDEPDLVGYWRFDEGSGDVAAELTGQSNDGQIGSGLSWVEVDDYPVAPLIVETAPPTHTNIAPGGSGELGPVLLFGDYEADATFQWFKDGVELEGQTGAGLMIDNATIEEHAGTYTVRVSHPLLDTPLEYNIQVRIAEAGVPAAGGMGLGILAGTLALLGGAAHGIRRMRK